jgi:hypothetical protein
MRDQAEAEYLSTLYEHAFQKGVERGIFEAGMKAANPGSEIPVAPADKPFESPESSGD